MPVATTVKLDLDGSGAFATTISQYLLEATVRQGRTKSLDPMPPATATVKLNNADGRFSPDGGGPYSPDFDDNGVGIRIEAGTRRFTGYIVEIQQDPFIENQEVVLTCTDRLGLLARQNLSCGLFRQQPLHLVLNRVLDILEAGEEVTNPGGEGGLTTGYSAAASGTTITATDTTSFEGDWCIQAVCDGTVSGQGIRYDVGEVATEYKTIALFARTAPGDGSATLTIRGLNAAFAQVWTTTINVPDSGWTYEKHYVTPYVASHRYIEVITGSAVALTILLDDLHQVPITSMILRSIPTTLDAEVELFGLYNQLALENLNRLLATEAAGFLYMRGYGTIYASAQVVRDAKTVPSATFGDNGTDVPYVGLAYGLDARERISRAEVRSGGTYEARTEKVIVWTLSPTGQTIPATESKVFQALYSQPARGCELSINPTGIGLSYSIAASGNDGTLVGTDGAYPPAVDGANTDWVSLSLGQKYYGDYGKYRTYLRWDTSGIGGGETVIAARLRMKLRTDTANTPFTIQVRTKAWGATLATGDWDGTGTIQGTYATGSLPPTEQYFEIELDPAAIQKTAWTEFELTSDRDVANTTPTGWEYLTFYSFDFAGASFPPVLLVTLAAPQPEADVFESYGVGALIEVGAGATDLVINEMLITGYPFQACSEESVVVADAITPPVMPATLSVEMPCQGTRTPDMVAEATRLALRHSGKVRRLPLSLQEQDAASLAQMQTRELDDLVTVINEAFAFSTKINDNFFIEGMDWTVSGQGNVLEVVYNLEEA